KVIAYAHDTALSGHGSISSTFKKMYTILYMKGGSDKCRVYVKSCLLCQKGGNKSVGGKAKMYSMPQCTKPFDKVYIDLVGEIHPASSEGHRYILCGTDSCTHFPFAVPLKRTDSVTIAEALLSQFNVFGHPKSVISDNGSNLTSKVMDEIYRLYGIKMHQIAVYAPTQNSIQERSHAVIKGILKKLCAEQPRQWLRYIDPLLFAIRTTQNTNGYTPFELLFGRLSRTYMAVLRDLWTGEDDEPEVKTTYQYVLDLRNRIEETCQLAQKEIEKTHQKNAVKRNLHAKTRVLKPGDKVLVLSPRPKNKLEFIWKGPAIVLERKGQVNYRIQFDSGTERIYHINMLKAFISREQPTDSSPVANNDDVTSDLDNDDDDEDEYCGATQGLLVCSDDEGDDDYLQRYQTEQTETWRDVVVNPELSIENKRKVERLLSEYADIFSDVPSKTTYITHKIKLKTNEPVYWKPYKVPVHLMSKVEQELQ